MRGIIHRLLNPRQRQFTVRPQQRQTLQSLRQRQQITFIAVAQQLTGRVIKLQIILLCARGEPARQLGIFRRLAAYLHRPAGQRRHPCGVLLRFRQLITANDEQ